MILLSVDEVVSLHRKIITATGGSYELRDRGLLESAIYSAAASFDDSEIYPSVPEKAARLAFGLINNHAFIDGNKRIGVFVMLMTLRLNGINLSYTQDELVNLGLGVASGKFIYEDILNWIHIHTQS